MKVQFDSRRRQEPTRDKGVRIPYAPSIRKISQWRWYLILLIVSSPLLYFLAKLFLSYLVVTSPGFITLDKVSINSTATGIVTQVNVKIGDVIDEGHLLATLYNPELNERQYVLQSELTAINRPETSTGLQTDLSLLAVIRIAKEQVVYQSDNLSNVRFLYEAGAATIAELNLAEAHYNKALYDLNLAEGNLATIRERRQQGLAAGEKDVETRRQTIQAKLKAIDQQQHRLKLNSAYAGRILDIFVGQGESLSTGTPIVSLGRVEKPIATVYLDPKYAKYALKGNMATITLPDGSKIRARVREDARLIKRLPGEISSPIGSRELMLITTLDFLSPLPAMKSIDGLPISARFDTIF